MLVGLYIKYSGYHYVYMIENRNTHMSLCQNCFTKNNQKHENNSYLFHNSAFIVFDLFFEQSKRLYCLKKCGFFVTSFKTKKAALK